MEIKIQNVTRQFGNQFTLKNICLHFPAGSKVGLIGPNGSGKSTLMRILMDLIHLDEGKIHFFLKNKNHSPSSPKAPQSSLKNDNDRESSNQETKQKNQKFTKNLNHLNFQIKKKIAYVPQIFPYFSSPLKEVVRTIRDIHDFSMKDFQNILKTFSLNYSSIMNRPFHKLSGGMKQKILIALSFTAEPDLLLLDEPTSSLDPLSRQIFYKMCLHLKKDKSLILCSHRLEEIRHLIDQVVVLEEGKVVYFGSASTYLNQMTLCLMEVLAQSNTKNDQILNEMGFSLSSSLWWHKIVIQEKKLNHLEEIQKKIGKDLKNIIIRDVDKGTDLVD